MTDYLTDEAVKSIKANKNRPFFMYFAPNAIHTPLQATERTTTPCRRSRIIACRVW